MAGYDGLLGAVPYKLDFPSQGDEGGTSASGTWTFQNSTPTDVRFQNSEPGFGDTAPYSARTYANQAGSIGKNNEIQAPADLARPYLCDLDNSRPGYLAPRLAWERTADGKVQFLPTAGGGTVNSSIWALCETQLYGMGAIVSSIGGSDAGLHFYQYDVANRRYAQVRQIGNQQLNDAFVNGQGTKLRGSIQKPVIRETMKGRIWYPLTGGGAIDLGYKTPTYPQSVIMGPGTTVTATTFAAKFWHFVSFGGYLMTFEQTDFNGNQGGMTVSLRDPDTLEIKTPTSLSGIDASPELGNAPIQELVPDVLCAHPPIVYSGAVYVCTDRQVLKIVYDDNNCRILCVPIHTTFTRITGCPEIFQGSLFVPSGNTLWKWTPGQLEFTPVPVDSFGDMPPRRGGGIISALQAVANGLLVAVQSDPSAGTDSSLLEMDANNVFQMLDYSPGTSNATLGVLRATINQGIMYFIDSSNGQAGASIGIVTTDPSASKRVIAVRESSRDPAFIMTASARPQVAGSHFWLSPVDPGVGYGDFKQGLKVSAGCADVSAAQIIRIYYQCDYENLLADDLDSANGGYGTATAGTLMENMGRWHLALTLNNNAALKLTQTLSGGYAGFTEKSIVASNLSYRTIRWAVEIIGDVTGTLYPRLTGFKYYYSETPAMYIVHALRIRILANDPDLADAPRTGSFPPPRTPADVYAHFSQIYSYAKLGSFIDFVDPNGDTRKGKVTKFIFNGVSLQDTPDGIPTLGRRRFDRVILQLALQEAESAA